MTDSEKEKAKKVNDSIGYGPNNPEPAEFKETNEATDSEDALHAASEYINKKD